MLAREIPVCNEMMAECRQAQARADRVAQDFGDSAPPPLVGETPLQYRRRLISGFAQHSKAWRGTDLDAFSDKALDVVEDQVYAAARREAAAPRNIPAGQLVERVTTDETGRRIKRFFGDPEVTWGPFKTPSRIVTGWSGLK
jgi:hypothetical protein